MNITAKKGERINLSALGSTDPDGDALSFRWFCYGEAGTLATATGSTGQAIQVKNADQQKAWFEIPKYGIMLPGTGTIHIILAVTDQGTPRLTRYKRIIITVV